jgi:2-dehydro-3-deoxygalactonokinase
MSRYGRVGGFHPPGNRSKWARVEDRKLVHFTTYMTGEIYAALKDHTIFGRLIEAGPIAEAAFEAGVRRGASEPSLLLHQLFTARTLPLFDMLTRSETADYLSGLLIGAELQAGGNGRALRLDHHLAEASLQDAISAQCLF